MLLFNVADYGANPVNGFDNTPAFQAALDAAAVNGGTVIIPACGAWPNQYFLDKPLFLNGDNITVRGEDEKNSVVWTWGPAFYVGRHPKLWHYNSASYTENGQTKSVVSDGVFRFDDFKVDLLEYKNSSYTNPIDISLNKGQAFGLRPRNLVKAFFPGCLAATCGREGYESGTGYTFEFMVCAHEASIEGGIAGMGEVDNPDPWLLSGTNGKFVFSLALTDDTLLSKEIIKLSFNQAQGIQRITVQLNFVTNTYSIFLNRTQVAATLEFVTSGKNLSNAGQIKLLKQFNRVARWEYADFTVASQYRDTSRNTDVPNYVPNDYAVLGFKMHRNCIYSTGGVGSRQQKLDNSTLDDNDYLMVNNRPCYVGMHNPDATDCHVVVMTHDWKKTRGMLVPIGNGPMAVANCSLQNFKLTGFDFFPGSDGITLGPYLHLSISNVHITKGFYHSIGSTDTIVSYPLYLTNTTLAGVVGFFGQNMSHVLARNTTFGYIGRASVKMVGSGSAWYGGMTNDAELYTEAFYLGYAGKGIGAGVKFEDFMIDTEGLRPVPRLAYFYQQKHKFVINNGFHLKSVSVNNTSGVPIVYLDDPFIQSYLNFPAPVTIESCAFTGEGPLLKIKGKDWIGHYEVQRDWCGSDTVEVVTSPAKCTNVKLVHRDLSAPPNVGGYTAETHVINLSNIPEGGVRAWRCSKSGIIGSKTPPEWTPDSFRFSYQDNTLSGNIFSSFYVALQFLNGSDPVNSQYGVFQDIAADKLFRFLFNNVDDIDRNTVRFISTLTLGNRTTWMNDGCRVSQPLANTSLLWTTAVSGKKQNSASVTLTCSQPRWDLADQVVLRNSGFFINLGNQNYDAWRVTCLIGGRMARKNASFFDNTTLTIPPAGLEFGFNGTSGWSVYMQNKLLDMLFGNVAFTRPTTYYFGLSRTAVTTEGKGIDEPVGGGYARVGVAVSTMVPHDEYSSTYSNAIPIQFARPVRTWGTVNSWFISDALTGGNLIACGRLNKTVNITSGSAAPNFPIGAFQIQV